MREASAASRVKKIQLDFLTIADACGVIEGRQTQLRRMPSRGSTRCTAQPPQSFNRCAAPLIAAFSSA